MIMITLVILALLYRINARGYGTGGRFGVIGGGYSAGVRGLGGGYSGSFGGVAEYGVTSRLLRGAGGYSSGTGGYGISGGFGGSGFSMAVKPYNVDYEAPDGQGGVQYKTEQGDGSGAVQGTYGYTNAQGLYRVVEYIADSNGFTATVKTNEPGMDGKENPADINLLVEPAPARIQPQYTSVSGFGSGFGGVGGLTSRGGLRGDAGAFGGYRGVGGLSNRGAVRGDVPAVGGYGGAGGFTNRGRLGGSSGTVGDNGGIGGFGLSEMSGRSSVGGYSGALGELSGTSTGGGLISGPFGVAMGKFGSTELSGGYGGLMVGGSPGSTAGYSRGISGTIGSFGSSSAEFAGVRRSTSVKGAY